MGLYFRKSKSVGPMRVNFSKSGIGISTGVKGARLSVGPRGTYINLGRNGVYYRKKIGGKKVSRKQHAIGFKSNNSQADYNNTIAAGEDVIRVQDTSCPDLAPGLEIIKDIHRSRLLFWLWILASVVFVSFLEGWGVLLMLITAILFERYFSARLHITMDRETELEWKKFSEIIYEMGDSNKLWIVENISYSTNAKTNAGADYNISRGNANVKLIKANKRTGLWVRSDTVSALIKSKKCRILCIPTGILVKKGLKYASYSYEQLNFNASTTKFIEVGKIAKDSEIIEKTWQYVNKDGTADKRFKNNRQIPVCLYGALNIKGKNLDIQLQTSDKNATRNVENAFQNYKKYISNIKCFNHVGTDILSDTSGSLTEKSSDNQTDSPKVRKLLEKRDQTIRQLGKDGYIGVLEEQLGCRITFIDGQVYHQHAVFLYKADEVVSDRMSALEYAMNKNTPYKHRVEIVSDKEFLVHLYLDELDESVQELPLSEKLSDALEKSITLNEEQKTKNQGDTDETEDENYTGISGAQAGSADDLLHFFKEE